MTRKNKGLGQGIDLLFSNETNDELYFQCNIENIIANKYQPRNNFEEEALNELAASIQEHGILQPLIVRKLEDENKYELIAGERRLRASNILGLETVPVIVHDIENENTLLELALIENIQRTDLNSIEEAEAYERLMSQCSYTQEEAAKKLGKSRSAIANVLRLLKLPDYCKTDIIKKKISEGHARALLRLIENPVLLHQIRDQIIAKNLSVRQTEALVKKALLEEKSTLKKKLKIEEEKIPESYCHALTNQLAAKLHSKVSIIQNGGRGKIEIEYYSHDDLERVMSLIVQES